VTGFSFRLITTNTMNCTARFAESVQQVLCIHTVLTGHLRPRRPVHRRFLLSRPRHFEHFPQRNFHTLQRGKHQHFLRPEDGSFIEAVPPVPI